MSDWPALLPCIILEGILLFIPGCLILLAAGIRRVKFALGSPLVSFAVIGISTLLTRWTSWNIGLILLVTGIVCMLAIGVRALCNRVNPYFAFKSQCTDLKTNVKNIGIVRLAWLFGSVLFSAALTFTMIATSVYNTDHFPQIYDAPFNMSVIRHILDTGCASPIGAGSVMGSESAVYPDVWHALAVLAITVFGNSIPQSIWTTTLALLMFVLPCSSCLLVNTLFKLRWNCSFFFASILPTVAAASLTSLISFGPLYSNLCGISALPTAIAFIILAFDEPETQKPRAVILALAIAVLGLGFAHPNTILTLTLFLLPLLISKCKTWTQRVDLAGFFALCWMICFNSNAFARTVNCLDRLPADTEQARSFARLIDIDYDTLISFDLLPIIMTCLVIAITTTLAVKLSRRWPNSWYLAALSILVCLVGCTLIPTNWFTRIATGFWYRDYYRLQILFSLFTSIALAAVPELALFRIRKKIDTHGNRAHHTNRDNRQLYATIAVACSLAFCTLGILGFQSHSTSIRFVTTPDLVDNDIALKEDRASFCEQVATLVDGSAVLNSHNDATVWLYPIYGVNALAKGQPANQISEMDKDYQLLITSIDQYGSNNTNGENVREAAERLDVKYYVQMGPSLDTVSKIESDHSMSYITSEASSRINADTPGFELILEMNDMRLWRLV